MDSDKRRKSDSVHIRPILEEFFQQEGLTETIHSYRAVAYWKKFVGQEIAAYTRAVEVNNKQLIVEVSSSVRVHYLQMQEEEIRNRVNYVLLEAPTKENATEVVSRLATLDGVDTIEDYPLAGLSPDYMHWLSPSVEPLKMKSIHYQVLERLLQSPRATAQSIATEIEHSTRRVVKALNDFVDCGSLWFTLRFHHNINQGLSVSFKVTLDTSTINQVDLVAKFNQEFPEHYFWSFHYF